MLTERLTKRWVATRYPTPNLAKTAGMKLKEFEDFFYGACLIDWDKQKQKQMTIKERLKGAKVIQILGAETDLKIGVAGRKLTLCYGKKNMPDGELYYAPLETFTNGYIKYTYPYNYNGQKIDGIFLRFKHGKVIYHNAVKNQKALTALLNTDPGSRVLGEAAFGTNEGITKFTGETLFDEKINGTVHITPGNAYPDSGGKNKSANHADIVKDLRPEFGGGEILVDGEVIQKNGKWTFI
jgi:aminopeptidase